MPDTKITALTAIGANPIIPATFPIPMVDLTDTSMAASGTTKKVTVNQILGAGGTATLASATITGDLTVRTNKLAVTSTGVGVGTASPLGPFHLVTTAAGYSDAGYFENSQAAAANVGPRLSLLGVGSVAMATIDAGWNAAANTDSYLRFLTRGTSSVAERYRIASDGVATWSNVGGVAGTAMTLNSTGLGVGGSPNFKLDVAGAANSAPITLLRLNNIGTTGGGPGIAARLQFNAGATALGFVQGCNFASGSIGVQISGDGTNIHQTIDSSGNVGIGVQPNTGWQSSWKALDIGSIGGVSFGFGQTDITSNVYRINTGDARYKSAGSAATSYTQVSGTHIFLTAGVAANANDPITFNPALTINASGLPIFLATTTTPASLTTNGELTFTATSNTNLRFSYRGSDGATRVANITLA